MEVNYKYTQQDVANQQKILMERADFYKGFGLDITESHRNIIRLIKNRPHNILEIGTGKGNLTTLLTEVCENIVTVELDKETQFIAALNVAGVNGSDKVRFVISDSLDLDFPDETFDLTISCLTYHHFDDPIHTVKEMLRVTKSQMIISDFNEHSFDIIDKIHLSEGRKHPRKNGKLETLKPFFDKQGLQMTKFSDECQNVYIVKKGGKL